MRCGNCKNDHTTVDAVRTCHLGIGPDKDVAAKALADEAAAAQTLDRLSGVGASTSSGPMWPASPKQIDYALGLQDERRLPDDWTIRDRGIMERMERDEVSSLITMLKSFPKGASKPSVFTMPPGRYALDGVTQLCFYEVSKGKGRWEGYVFIKQLLGSPRAYRKVDMTPAQRASVLSAIQADPKSASLRYGREARICGICSSPLTNTESRKAGIGPICRGKVGW